MKQVFQDIVFSGKFREGQIYATPEEESLYLLMDVSGIDVPYAISLFLKTIMNFGWRSSREMLNVIRRTIQN